MDKIKFLLLGLVMSVILVGCGSNDKLEGSYEVGANDPANFQAIFTFDEDGGLSVDSPSESEILNERGTYEILDVQREDNKKVIVFEGIGFSGVKIYTQRDNEWLFDPDKMTLEEAREYENEYMTVSQYCEQEDSACSDKDYTLYLTKK